MRRLLSIGGAGVAVVAALALAGAGIAQLAIWLLITYYAWSEGVL